MIGVIVRDNQVVDCLHPSAFRRLRDAIGIAAAEAGPSGVYHRLFGWRDDQGRLPALGVDEVDFEGFRRLSDPGGTQQRKSCNESHGSNRIT